MRKIRKTLVWAVGALLGAGVFFPLSGGETKNGMAGQTQQTLIKVNNFYNPNTPEAGSTSRLLELMEEDPEIRIENWAGISLPGGAGKASLMMAIAGGTAPDIGETWFHLIQNEIKQQFLCPLNEWICKDYDPEHPMAWDKNGNGIVDDDETIWEPWKKIPYLWRQVAMANGKIYGIPQVGKGYVGIVFRRDLVRNAGLNPDQPPKTWDELKYWCQRLSTKDVSDTAQPSGQVRGRRGLGLFPNGFYFLPWMQSAGGSPIIQIRKSPKTGKDYTFSMEAETFMTPDGENLQDVKPLWRANFNSPEGLAAVEMYRDLFYQKWLKDPENGEPVDLTAANIAAGEVTVDERVIRFAQGDVITGMGRALVGGGQNNTPMQLFSRGEIVMMMSFVNDLDSMGSSLGISPDLLSWFPVPAANTPEGKETVQVQNHYIVAYEHVARRSKTDRERIWTVMTSLADQKAKENSIREKVLMGMAQFVPPNDLKLFGYEEYLADVPQNITQNYERIDNGQIAVFTEPYMGFWLMVDMALNSQLLSLLMNNSDFDYKAALKNVNDKANSGMMFETPQEELDKYRPYARIILVVMIAAFGFLVFQIIRSQWKNRSPGRANANVHRVWVPYVLVLPAVLSIGLWGYYPLFRGMLMAFQDYRLAGESEFVGLNNFIILAFDKSFWMSLLRTVEFVSWNMALGFTAPIFLAIMLTEIPRFRILFRTLFFLPQMTSGLVIALLWMLMYNPTPEGFFNQLVEYLNYIPFVDIEPQRYLQDPKLAMVCCVIPSVWAGMGMGSLIYLAALQSIPPDLYEAADIDGAGIWAKIWHITIPTLLPLIVINFVGTFIGTFQNMGNIFLMTFGGPGEATTVTGLKIWQEAYTNLRFSMATSMAWVLGSLLIGFTYFQIKFLSRIEYKKAKTE